ncbi:MAG: hypothetical protein AB1483_03970 [Candidatus Zixiibacteriota bacterium]
MLWQQVIIGGAIVLAGLYVVIYYVRRRRLKAGCKSCPALKAMEDKGKTSISKTSTSV